MMNTGTQNQIQEVKTVAVSSSKTGVTKHCTNCETELPVYSNIHYTNFGLNLCDDCLYS